MSGEVTDLGSGLSYPVCERRESKHFLEVFGLFDQSPFGLGCLLQKGLLLLPLAMASGGSLHDPRHHGGHSVST